jgi:hypothetical protein
MINQRAAHHIIITTIIPIHLNSVTILNK